MHFVFIKISEGFSVFETEADVSDFFNNLSQEVPLLYRWG